MLPWLQKCQAFLTSWPPAVPTPQIHRRRLWTQSSPLPRVALAAKILSTAAVEPGGTGKSYSNGRSSPFSPEGEMKLLWKIEVWSEALKIIEYRKCQRLSTPGLLNISMCTHHNHSPIIRGWCWENPLQFTEEILFPKAQPPSPRETPGASSFLVIHQGPLTVHAKLYAIHLRSNVTSPQRGESSSPTNTWNIQNPRISGGFAKPRILDAIFFGEGFCVDFPENDREKPNIQWL